MDTRRRLSGGCKDPIAYMFVGPIAKSSTDGGGGLPHSRRLSKVADSSFVFFITCATQPLLSGRKILP